jgi:hypothetical protein
MQWEYDKITVKYEMNISELNKMGNSGWELVAVTYHASGCYTYYFKRLIK